VRFLGIPASGVTTTAYRTVTDTTATAGQTSFSIPSYTVGYISVFRNGSLLAGSDYTATTGTTVVLANAASAGDTITTESFYVSSVLNAIPATNASITSSYLASGLTLTNPTLTSPTMSGAVVSTMASSVITSGTAVASTSGTSIDFTSIPSWVKRITVIFNGVSLSGTSSILMQLGVGSTPTISGYTASQMYWLQPASGYGGANSTSGFPTQMGSATYVMYGTMVFNLLNSNTWIGGGTLMNQITTAYMTTSNGSIALGGSLGMVRITTANGTDTFDAGSINILYE
jgi:hypothetical protein